MKNKIILNHKRLRQVINKLQNKDKRIVFTNGCFDLLHLGHTRYLAKAKNLGDYLVVAVNSDKSLRRIKPKGRPINNQNARIGVLSSLEVVDFVTLFEGLTPLNIIKVLKPDILVKGADWQAKDIVGREILKSYGGRVKRISYLKGYSTTAIIEKIAKTK